jgi:hypothetical protein
VRTDGQALVHILFLAALRGLIVRGPMVGRQHAYVLVRDWLGPTPRLPERPRALAELARRYLIGHAPASARDLARWAGLPLRDARAGLGAIASALVERPDGLVSLRPSAPLEEAPQAVLLGAFDPLLVGWRDRTFITGAHDATVVSGGVFRPFALVGSRLAALWRVVDRARVEIAPIVPLAAAERAPLDADAAAVSLFLGLDR